MKFTFAAVILSALPSVAVAADEVPCNPDSRTFTVELNIYASELGYYQFEECGDVVNPTLGMEVGETYTFIQRDPSNYYHPMGFAYYPDGAHTGKDELEPGITQSNSTCAATMTCPAPMYMLNGSPLGNYSNDASVATISTNEGNFGLDDYEPMFFTPIGDWVAQGEHSIKLNFDDANYDKDIFYFCHIHQFMSGRIKLLQGGIPISVEDDPPLGYSYETVNNEFDKGCGTYGLNPFQLPHAECPARFVCLADSSKDGNRPPVSAQRSSGGSTNRTFDDYAQCIDAMDCHMMAKMTTGSSVGSETVLFIHQMIPHHQNAVNMAKATLKAQTLNCPDLSDDSIPDCVMEGVLRSIIVDQNRQIQQMRKYLESYDYPQTDDCVVPMFAGSQTGEDSADESSAKRAWKFGLLRATLAAVTLVGIYYR